MGVAKKYLGTSHFLTLALLLFMGLGFFVTKQLVWCLFFYALVMPGIVFAIYKQGRSRAWVTPLFMWALVLVAWSGLALLWGENPGHHRVQHYAGDAVFTLFFIAANMLALHHNRAIYISRVGDVLIGCGLVNALIAIGCFVFLPEGPRLAGFALTRHAILGAMLVSSCHIFSLNRFLAEKALGKRLFYGMACLVFLLFIALTQSRGPYLAVMASSIVLLVVRPGALGKVKLACLSAAFAAVCGVLVYCATWQNVWASLIQRGDDHRFEIWRFTWQRIQEHPWVGHGPAAYLGMAEQAFSFPHSLYLSTVFYSGFIGFALLVVLLVRTGIKLVKTHTKDTYAPLIMALIAGTLVGGLTDLGQVAPEPGVFWFIFWLPLCFAFSEPEKTPR